MLEELLMCGSVWLGFIVDVVEPFVVIFTA